MKIDLGSFEDKLREISKFKNKLYDELDHGQQKHVDQVWQVVDVTIDTNSYPTIWGLLKKHFGSFTTIKPRSVLAIFGGCSKDYDGVSDFSSETGSSAFCAGSAPRPKSDDSFKFSSKNVLFASHDGKKYTFHHLHKVASSSDGFLHQAEDDISKVKGFTNGDKAQLKSFGIKRVQLISVSITGKHQVVSPFIPVEELPSGKTHKTHNSGGNGGVILIIVIIIIALVIIYFLFSQSGRSNRSSSGSYGSSSYGGSSYGSSNYMRL